MGAGALTSCSEKGPDNPNKNPDDNTSEGIAENNGTLPSFDTAIQMWNGETADDADKDIVGTNADIYHELSSFTRKVTVSYSGNTASVITTVPGIKSYVDGAYVTIDFQTLDLSGVEITLTGDTGNGGIKIYGGSKYRLILDNVFISSQKGPAINSQCKKRVFISMTDGSRNMIQDTPVYAPDSY